jgi:LysM repeat protein
MTPPLPPGWFQWAFWQYSQTGRVNGINAPVDLDLFNGTLEELYRFANAQMTSTPVEHVIAEGDTFESIANKYGVTVRELVMANPQLLRVGEKLKIPPAVAIPQESASPGPKTYIVKPGDTLTSIAIKFNTTVAALVAANQLSNPNNITVGQTLIIP